MNNKNERLTVQSSVVELKNCPCCGGRAIMEGVFALYNSPAVIIKCTECRVQISPIGEETYLFYKGEKNVKITIHEAVIVATGMWNKRVSTKKQREDGDIDG